MTALFVLFILEIFVFLLALFINKIDLLSPSVVVCMVFVFTIGLAVFYHENWYAVKSFSWIACLIIVSGSLIFVLVDYVVLHFIVKNKTQRLYLNKGRDLFDINNHKIIIICIIDSVILFMFYRFRLHIVSLYNAMSAYGTATDAAAYRALYGHDTVVADEDQMSFFLRYSLYFMQATAYVFILPFVYNVLIKKNKFINNMKYLVPPVLFCIYSFMCGSRIDLLKLVISGFFMFYVLFLKNVGWTRKNIRQLAVKGSKIATLILVLFFFLSSLIGRSALDGSVFDSFIAHLAGYAGAPVIFFSQFILDPITSNVVGEECFTNFFSFLHRWGLSDLVRTGHLEYRHLTGGIIGNVYTFFRSPIADYGIIGMYIFTTFVSIFFSVYYYRKIKYANYLKKDRFCKNLVIYSVFFQWISFASINQLSSTFVSISFLIIILFVLIIYDFCYCLDTKSFILKRR